MLCESGFLYTVTNFRAHQGRTPAQQRKVADSAAIFGSWGNVARNIIEIRCLCRRGSLA